MSLSKEEKELYKKMGASLGRIRENNPTGKYYTQEEVAEEINMKPSNYNTIECGNGERHLKDFQIIRLVKLYNASADCLLGLTKEPTTDENLKQIYKECGLTEKSINILKTLKKDKYEGINALIGNEFIFNFSEDYVPLVKLNKCKYSLIGFTLIKHERFPNMSLDEKIKLLDTYKDIIVETIAYINEYLKDTTLLTFSFDISEIEKQIEITKSDFSSKNIDKLDVLFQKLKKGLLHYEDLFRFSISSSFNSFMLDIFEENIDERIEELID